MNYSVGQRVKHRVYGYDYGSKPIWIPATVLAITPRRIKISFHLKDHTKLVRYAAQSTLVPMDDCNSVFEVEE